MKEDMAAVLDIFLDSRLRQVHTVLPGKIVSYDSSTRKATVKPLIKLKFIAGEIVKTIQINPISNVPVIFEGSKKFSFKYPLKADDGCLLLFAESPIGNFLSSSGEVEADDLTRFSLTDCIAIPGLFSFANIPQNCPIQFEIDELDNIDIKTGAMEFKLNKVTGKFKISANGISLKMCIDNYNTTLKAGSTVGSPAKHFISQETQVALDLIMANFFDKILED